MPLDIRPTLPPDPKKWRADHKRLAEGPGAHMNAALVAAGWIATSNVHARGWQHPITLRHYTLTQAYKILTSAAPSRTDILRTHGWVFNPRAPSRWAWSHPSKPGTRGICDAWKMLQKGVGVDAK